MTLANFAADKIFATKKSICPLDLAVSDALLDESCAHLFAVDGDILYRHIPDAVLLVFGIIFERGRLALGARAEAEVLAAHIRLYVYMLFHVVQEI